MKKALSLILALIMCLSLCACGGEPDVETQGSMAEIPTTENHYDVTTAPSSTDTEPTDTMPTEDPEKNERYEYALSLLSKDIHPEQGNEFKEAYEILTELDDYKDAKEYLSRFTIIPNVLLFWTGSELNAFGEVIEEVVCNYCYDAQGQIILGPTFDCYQPRTSPDDYIYLYTYNSDGRVIEKQLFEYQAPQFPDHPPYSKLISSLLLTYNDLDQLVEKRGVNADGTTASIATLSYDDAGMLVKEETQYSNGAFLSVSYIYDGAGRLIKLDYMEPYSDLSCEYNEDGLLSKELSGGRVGKECFYDNGLLVCVQYEECTTNYTYGDYYCYTPAE